MGLMDVLNGMQNGPHGPRGPSTDSGGGMSPLTMAVLGLLAYKTFKSFTSHAAPQPATPGAPGQGQSASPGGGMSEILKNGLGTVLAGGAAGGILSGGLNDLLKQFQQSGHGDVAKSWVDNAPNKAISTDDLAKALGGDQIETLMAHTGLSRQDLLAGLSQQLPETVNQLTPDGRLPTEQELSRSL
ncbi:MAG TPA: YidB family protein [Xanthobacteraceae bacterium]|nr:YidB family protein [Xanthobacteraceae bacterium]